MGGRVFLARMHFHIQGHTQGAQENGVISMAGAARLMGIITHFGSFLTAIDRLDRHIQISNPGLIQGRSAGFKKRLGLPLGQSRWLFILEGSAQTVFTDHLFHSQSLRVDLITAQRGNVCVTTGPAQNRQHRCAQHVSNQWRIWTGVT